MNDLLFQYGILTAGFGLLRTAAYLGGAVVCVVHRRISRWLILVSVGFAVEFLVASLRLIDAMILAFSTSPFFPTSLFYFGMDVLSSIAKIAVVVGLWMAFSDIRRKLALSKGPDHELA